MFEAKDILTLIGIPVEKVKALQVIKDEEESIIRIELLDIKTYCPHCGSTQTEIKDYYVVRINNSIIKHNKLTVIIRVRRYRCKKCGRSFKQNYEFVEKGASISNAVKGAILDDLKEMLTMAQIAKDHNVSDMTVIRIFDKCILPQLALKMTEIICVDEFCFKHNKKYGKYPCVITDPLTGKIIDIIESRWKNILIDYFNKVKLPERRYVKYFVSDMNETYRQIKNIFFHDAIHIADRFHLIRLFNDAITAIRTRIIKQEACFDLKEYILSSFFLGLICSMRSNVTVELDVRTREDSVDIEAERTRTITTPTRIVGRFSSIVGMMESYMTEPSSL